MVIFTMHFVSMFQLLLEALKYSASFSIECFTTNVHGFPFYNGFKPEPKM